MSLAQQLSFIIPALDAGSRIGACIDALQAFSGGKEIVVVDGGSADDTRTVAASRGATVVSAERGRGRQLSAGAEHAHGTWLLFVHADTVLAGAWAAETTAFMADARNIERAAYFTFALDDSTGAARRLETLVAWRCRTLALPYGDQGLLISRRLYDRTGGFRPLPIMEDVDLIQRIPRAARIGLSSKAVTSADRYRKNGYVMRPLRNVLCQSLWRLGVPADKIVRFYK